MSHVVWEADADCYRCSSHEDDQTYAELLKILLHDRIIYDFRRQDQVLNFLGLSSYLFPEI